MDTPLEYLEYHLKNTDAKPAYETLEIGSPLDYTNDVYRVYFEVPDATHEAKKIISSFLGPERSEKIVTLAHGYEMALGCNIGYFIVPTLRVNVIKLKGLAAYGFVGAAPSRRWNRRGTRP